MPLNLFRRNFDTSSLAHWGGELVAAARHSDDKAETPRIRLNLSSQPHDLHVDAPVVGFGVAPGDELQELFARQDASWALNQRPQQTELRGAQRDFLARLIRE